MIAMGVWLLVHHMGLGEAIARVIAKIAKCHKCVVFWGVLGTMLLIGANPLVAVMLSVFSAYLSNWLGLLLMWLNKMYNNIWQKLNK